MESSYVPSISSDKLTLGDLLGGGSNGIVFAAKLRGLAGDLDVCAKVRHHLRLRIEALALPRKHRFWGQCVLR
jgi:hypothetical protein